MSFKSKHLLKERRLVKAKTDRKLVVKEIRAAVDDLKTAENSFKDGNFKVGYNSSYYSMFHSARALLYSKGYREKSHYALLIAIKELFSHEISLSLIHGFEDAMSLREAADYGLTFS
jgi:uncharacterized protein (UPF0332 family)